MKHITRKEMLTRLSAGAIGAGFSSIIPGYLQKSADGMGGLALNGNINHSVCRWTYGNLSLQELCVAVKEIGFSAIDLVGPGEWQI